MMLAAAVRSCPSSSDVISHGLATKKETAHVVGDDDESRESDEVPMVRSEKQMMERSIQLSLNWSCVPMPKKSSYQRHGKSHDTTSIPLSTFGGAPGKARHRHQWMRYCILQFWKSTQAALRDQKRASDMKNQALWFSAEAAQRITPPICLVITGGKRFQITCMSCWARCLVC